MPIPATFIQHSIGSPSHSSQTKRNKRYPNCKVKKEKNKIKYNKKKKKKNFIVPGLTFRYLIQFEFVFICGVKEYCLVLSTTS